MTKKHYIAIAEILKRQRSLAITTGETARIATTTRALSELFKNDNPDFDRDKFFSAILD